MSVVTFGADPDKPEAPPPEKARRPRKKGVRDEMVHFFVYHPKLRMDQRLDREEQSILHKFFDRKIQAGISRDTLKELIELFYVSGFAQSQYPARVFVSKAAQSSLSRELEVKVDDPVLQWLAEGMLQSPIVGDDYRQALKSCEESLLRYPDLVARIVRSDDREAAVPALLQLEDLILWNIEPKGSERPLPETNHLRAVVTLPKELASSRRSPKMLRVPATDGKTAIMWYGRGERGVLDTD